MARRQLAAIVPVSMWTWIPLRLQRSRISPAARQYVAFSVGVFERACRIWRAIVGPEHAMVEPLRKQDTRTRCEAACRKLEEAIEELDDCGLDIYATHAHLCLELVRDHLSHRD